MSGVSVKNVVFWISAALIIGIVPICILIAVFQERVVGGLTRAGVKG